MIVAQHSTEYIRRMHLNEWMSVYSTFYFRIGLFHFKIFQYGERTIVDWSDEYVLSIKYITIGAWIRHDDDQKMQEKVDAKETHRKKEKTGSEFSVFHLRLFLD